MPMGVFQEVVLQSSKPRNTAINSYIGGWVKNSLVKGQEEHGKFTMLQKGLIL